MKMLKIISENRNPMHKQSNNNKISEKQTSTKKDYEY